MYGISEAPDNGLVLSGNSSDNVDDNYMIKLNPCLTTNACQCDVPYSLDVSISSSNFNMTDGQTHFTNLNVGMVRINYNGLCLNTGCCAQNDNEVTWNVYRKSGPGGRESIYQSGNSKDILFFAFFRDLFSVPVREYQYRIEIKHSCGGNDCGTINLNLKRA